MQTLNNSPNIFPVPFSYDENNLTDTRGSKNVLQCIREDRFAAEGKKQFIAFIPKAPTGTGGYYDDRYFQYVHLLVCDFYENHAACRRLQS